MRRRYEVIISTSKHGYGFERKADAILFAIEQQEEKGWNNIKVFIKNMKNGQLTHLLHRSRTSCRVCGCELNGRKSCPLCGAKHVYL